HSLLATANHTAQPSRNSKPGDSLCLRVLVVEAAPNPPRRREESRSIFSDDGTDGRSSTRGHGWGICSGPEFGSAPASAPGGRGYGQLDSLSANPEAGPGPCRLYGVYSPSSCPDSGRE